MQYASFDGTTTLQQIVVPQRTSKQKMGSAVRHATAMRAVLHDLHLHFVLQSETCRAERRPPCRHPIHVRSHQPSCIYHAAVWDVLQLCEGASSPTGACWRSVFCFRFSGVQPLSVQRGFKRLTHRFIVTSRRQGNP